VKLALVRQKYTPFGGAERFVERALTALRAQSADVTIIARSWQEHPDPNFLRCDPFYIGRTWRDAGFARAVQSILAEDRFSLVQSHERIPGCHVYRAGDGVHATWLDLRSRARSAAPWLTSVSPWHRYTLAAEAAMFRHPNLRAVICNSRMVMKDIAARFGTPVDKLHVIYNGVDLTHFHPSLRKAHRVATRLALGISEATRVILFVGSGFERKGIPVLLQALAAMKQRDALLLVVGRDRKEHRMKALSQQLGIADRVRFLGALDDVRPYYGTADCFALPTLYDPMPNAALEALACGLPIVTTTTCGAAELVQSDASGRVVDALDRTALTEALDATLSEKHDPNAIAATVEHLSLDAMAERLLDLYRRAA
jgi:UDP-glucose:(heptosyl)LPS alpha-1,3-glucosyltransferase